MKGVICQQTDAKLVDVAHDFPRQDIRTCAFWLREILPYFPPAVHLVVVDPGVGTDRAAIVIRAGDHALVGPDNGVLIPAARTLADDDFDVFEIPEQHSGDTEATTAALDTVSEWPPNPSSSTFHGRDVFAPAAARVHEDGIYSFEAESGFEPLDTFEDLRFPEPTIRQDGASGTVLAVDGFGNVITNIPGSVIRDQDQASATVNGVSTPIGEMYAAVDSGDRLVTVGSHGNVECAVNQGRGDDAFGLEAGDSVELSL